LRGVTKKGNRGGGLLFSLVEKEGKIHRFIASLSSLQELPSKIFVEKWF